MLDLLLAAARCGVAGGGVLAAELVAARLLGHVASSPRCRTRRRVPTGGVQEADPRRGRQVTSRATGRQTTRAAAASRTSAHTGPGSGAGGAVIRASRRSRAVTNEPSAAAGRRAADRAQRAGQLRRRRVRGRDVVGPHLDQRGHRDLRADHPRHERRRRPPRDERQHHEVVAFAQVRTLVGEHGDDLAGVERLAACPTESTRRERRPGRQYATGRRGRARGRRARRATAWRARRAGRSGGAGPAACATSSRPSRRGASRPGRPRWRARGGGRRRPRAPPRDRAASTASALHRSGPSGASPYTVPAPTSASPPASPTACQTSSAPTGSRTGQWAAARARLTGSASATPSTSSPSAATSTTSMLPERGPARRRLCYPSRSRSRARSSGGMEPTKRASAAPRSPAASSATFISSATWSSRLPTAR